MVGILYTHKTNIFMIFQKLDLSIAICLYSAYLFLLNLYKDTKLLLELIYFTGKSGTGNI